MSNAYEFAKEVSQTSFDYGDLEERIGFVCDHYYDAMKIYRAIINGIKDADQKRDAAHMELQKLRNDEDRWNRAKKFPEGFDAEEHQDRKDYLSELREKEYDIMFNGSPLAYDKLSHMVYTHMWIFGILHNVDFKVRGRLGPFAAFTLRKFLWPMMKMMELTAKQTDDLDREEFLTESLEKMRTIPDKVKAKIIHP